MAEDTKRWRHISVTKGITYFDGSPIHTRWVRWNREFEDGYHRYQKGQIVEITDKEKWHFYLEAGHVTPCDAPKAAEKPKGPWEVGLFLMLDSFASNSFAYAQGKQYELPMRVGKKYCDRNLASFVKKLDPIDHERKPETATTRRG